MSIGRSRRLVGRDRELTALCGWLVQAGDGRGGVYVIAGEPGVGKSRLAGEAIAALPESWFVSRGRATDRGRPAPFRPVAEQAGQLMTEADQVLSGQAAFSMWRDLCRRLAAEAALAGGWGDPVSWLRECLAVFDTGGHRHAATACRVLLHRAGAAVPRRSGDAVAPPDLAALGVTAREADVLRLVADGLTNKEIGERLFLSPRTVESTSSGWSPRPARRTAPSSCPGPPGGAPRYVRRTAALAGGSSRFRPRPPAAAW